MTMKPKTDKTTDKTTETFGWLLVGLAMLYALVVAPAVLLFGLRLLGIGVPYTVTTWLGAVCVLAALRGVSSK